MTGCEVVMGLPEVERCCFCVSLETGCVVLAIISTVLCLGGIGLGSWQLPNHQQHRNEDNIVLMSLAMFCMLSAVCNIGALAGVFLKRSNYVQLALLSNVVFTVCILLVAVVGCLFSAALRPLLQQPGLLALCVVLMQAATAYAFYYLIILKSVYNKMKVLYGDSAIPV